MTRGGAARLTLFVAASSAAPSSFALDAHRPPERYSLRVWGKRDGLPSSWVKAILPSRTGYLWLATPDGLLRFDGVRFKAYGRLDSPGLLTENVHALFEGRDGRLWVGTSRGLAVGDAHGNAPFVREEGVGSASVRSIAQDSDGSVWALAGQGIWRLEGPRVTRFGAAQGVPGDGYRALSPDPAGGLWVATDQGLARIEAGGVRATYTVRDGLASNDVLSVLVDREGTLWVGTGGGLSRRPRGGTFERVPTAGARVIEALLQDRAGNVWAGTRDGLLRVGGGRADMIDRAAGLADEHVSALAEDAEGSLWVGTEAGGIARLREARAIVYGAAQGLTHEVVWTVREGRDGAVWIGTDGGGLNVLRGDRVASATPEQGFATENVYALHEDRAGRVWFSTGSHGLCRLAKGRVDCLRKPFDDDLARCLLEDREGRMWVGTSAALVRIDGDVVHPVATEHGGKITVTSLSEGPKGTLWVGTTAGLARVENDVVRRVSVGGKPHGDHVMSLLGDADGTLWLGTADAGLQRLRAGQLASVTSRQGLPSDNVLSVLDDGRGRIWLSSGQGILAIGRGDLEAVLDGGSIRISAIAITEADGLRDRECSGGVQPSAWLGHDGRLWYPTIVGVAVVDPRRVQVNARLPSIQIEEIVADGQRIAPDAASLPAGTRHLEIRYAAPSFAAPERLRFEHRLEGLDAGFFAAGADRVAHYTALGPRSYRFRVRAANEDGVWGEPGASLTFTVRPYFWQTRWFYALSVCGVLLAGAGIVELRVRRLRKREQELKRRVAEEVARVEVLSGMLPVCAWCRKVRDDAGYWKQIEQYISAHSKVEFTHGICPDCAVKLRAGSGNPVSPVS